MCRRTQGLELERSTALDHSTPYRALRVEVRWSANDYPPVFLAASTLYIFCVTEDGDGRNASINTAKHKKRGFIPFAGRATERYRAFRAFRSTAVSLVVRNIVSF